MDGWVGRILRVDLTQGDYSVEDLDPDLATDYIGGRGLASKFLFDEVDPTIDPLSPENKLLFASGPLTGTAAPSGGRLTVVTKSPQTGTITCANVGSYFGAELKFAGFDMLIVEGKSPDPVYLSIVDDEVEIKPAPSLWGKTTFETEDAIRDEIGDDWRARETYIACIGPAGEKLVKFAAIVHDKHTVAGRGGVGAVMGSKNLKAIAVRGTKAVSVVDGESFRQAVTDALNKWNADEGLSYFGHTGSAAQIAANSRRGCIPVFNHQQGTFEKAESLSWKAQKNYIAGARRACFGCPCHCRPVYKINEPGFEGKYIGLEYETNALLGPNCGIDNLVVVIKANDICNELGMDSMSAGGTMGTAMELFERGCLPEADVGFKLNFGNGEAMLELLKQTGLREGFGDILAEGGYEVAQRYGHPELFMGVKKLELPAYGPRRLQGIGLGYATSNRGACHNKAYTMAYESFAPPEWFMEPSDIEGKAALVKRLQDIVDVVDSAGVCLFPQAAMTPPFQIEDVVTLLEAATGAGYTLENVMLAGERIWNLERIFNLKAGFTKDDDTLPRRMTEEPLPDGPGKGQVNRLSEMLPEYYQLRGWDENGVPTREKLSELGLEDLL
jgi:aldehyde:ferredoxin oxidoreductase